MIKKLLLIVVLSSFFLLNVQGAVERNYLVREDFNTISGWEKNYSDANFTVQSGELVMGTPIHTRDNMWKNITVSEDLDNITVKMNIKGKSLGEPSWTTDTWASSYRGISIRFVGENGYIVCAIRSAIHDNNNADTLYNFRMYASISGNGSSVTETIYDEDNIPHETTIGTSAEFKIKKVTAISWEVEMTVYYEYNFTHTKSVIKTVEHLDKIKEIDVAMSSTRYYDTINTVFFSDMIYIYTEKEGKKEANNIIGDTDTFMLYLIPATMMGVGIFTAIIGNPNYKYVLLTSFAVFGIVATIDAQYVIAGLSYIVTAIYGYNLKKGGGLLG